MKKTDITMLVLIASVSVIVAYFVASATFDNKKNSAIEVKTIEAIKSDIIIPSKDLTNVFYDGALNPVVQVIIDEKQ